MIARDYAQASGMDDAGVRRSPYKGLDDRCHENVRMQAKTLGFSNMLDAVAYDVVAEDTKPAPAVTIEIRGGVADVSTSDGVLDVTIDWDAIEVGGGNMSADRLRGFIAGLKMVPAWMDPDGEALKALEEKLEDMEDGDEEDET